MYRKHKIDYPEQLSEEEINKRRVIINKLFIVGEITFLPKDQASYTVEDLIKNIEIN